MKIAVAFFGIPRCTRVSGPSIEQNVLAPLRSIGDVSVVYHLYLQDNVSNVRSGENGILGEENYDYFRQFRGILEAPDVALAGDAFAAWKAYGDPFRDDFASLRNLRCQLYSLLQVTRLVETVSADVTLFVRPDLVYHDPIPQAAVRLACQHPKACIIPNWQWWGGYCDRFAICGREAYWAYGARIRYATEFCRLDKGPLHPEQLLRFSLKRERIKVLCTPLRASRVRIDGAIKPESFNPKATLRTRRLRAEHFLATKRSELLLASLG